MKEFCWFCGNQGYAAATEYIGLVPFVVYKLCSFCKGENGNGDLLSRGGHTDPNNGGT